jgi:hypothetical protein
VEWRWATTVAWNKSTEFEWIQFVKGLQDAIIAAEAWIGCFPSSIVELEALDSMRRDEMLCKGGEAEFFELVWFDKSRNNLCEEVREFLDRQEGKSVVYVRNVEKTARHLGLES